MYLGSLIMKFKCFWNWNLLWPFDIHLARILKSSNHLIWIEWQKRFNSNESKFRVHIYSHSLLLPLPTDPTLSYFCFPSSLPLKHHWRLLSPSDAPTPLLFPLPLSHTSWRRQERHPFMRIWPFPLSSVVPSAVSKPIPLSRKGFDLCAIVHLPGSISCLPSGPGRPSTALLFENLKLKSHVLSIPFLWFIC